jgi:hypothetical protein
MYKLLFIAVLSATFAAPNLVIDYKCMPSVVCASLIGGIKSGGKTHGVQYINGVRIFPTNPLHRADGKAIMCPKKFCGGPIKYGNVTVSPASSTPACFEFPPISTKEASEDGYKRCITREENTMFYNTIEKYYQENNVNPGDAFYLTLVNIPESGCM